MYITKKNCAKRKEFMSKKTVIVLQDTTSSSKELEAEFSEDDRFTVIGADSDVESALQNIEKSKPDFLITEIVLPKSDGLYVIDKTRKCSPQTKIIVLSVLSSEEVIMKSMEAGAEYFMAKPYNANILKDRIAGLSGEEVVEEERLGKAEFRETRRRTSLEEKISNIFINVGIPPHIKGYSFLREGVKMAVENPSIINNITKKLYPEIGKRYSTTASKVERAIRHAIEVAWNRGRIESINSILGVRAYVGAEKPTNGEFIALVADKMLLERA